MNMIAYTYLLFAFYLIYYLFIDDTYITEGRNKWLFFERKNFVSN